MDKSIIAFHEAFYKEDMKTLRSLALRDRSLVTDDLSSDTPELFIKHPVALLLDGSKPNGAPRFSDHFAGEYVSYAIAMGFDVDGIYSAQIGSFVDAAWAANNAEAAAQILLRKIEKELLSNDCEGYAANSNVVMCRVGRSSEEDEFHHFLRTRMMVNIARIHDAVRLHLTNPVSPRAQKLASTLPESSYFKMEFPYEPDDHVLFARPSTEYDLAVERMWRSGLELVYIETGAHLKEDSFAAANNVVSIREKLALPRHRAALRHVDALACAMIEQARGWESVARYQTSDARFH